MTAPDEARKFRRPKSKDKLFRCLLCHVIGGVNFIFLCDFQPRSQSLYKPSKASFAFFSHTRVLQQMRTFPDEFQMLIKPYKSRKANSIYHEEMQNLEQKCGEKLFDIATRKCDNENSHVERLDKCQKRNKSLKVISD